jgi:hypothetical protein
MSRERSNSAIAETMCRSNLPLGVEVSKGSLVETNAIPRAANSSKVLHRAIKTKAGAFPPPPPAPLPPKRPTGHGKGPGPKTG